MAYGPLPSRSCGGLGGPLGLRKNIGWGQKLTRLPDYEAAQKCERGTKINLCYILSTGEPGVNIISSTGAVANELTVIYTAVYGYIYIDILHDMIVL